MIWNPLNICLLRKSHPNKMKGWLFSYITDSQLIPNHGHIFLVYLSIMRKALFISLCLLIACCAGSPKTESIGIASIRDGWRDKSITARNLGETPNVMRLLRAFNEVWPTAGADSIIAEAGDRLFVSNDVTEGGSGRVFVDCEDFNVASYDHDTGGQMFGARTYARQNGHTLLGIYLEQLNPEEIEFCCFYDYDPTTGVMTPEDVPYADFKPEHDGAILSYWLTEGEYDQDIIIVETSPDDSYPTLYHHFTFNGTRHVYSGSSEEYIYPEYEEEEKARELEERRYAEKLEEMRGGKIDG